MFNLNFTICHKEFNHLYIFNLRGNQRTQGEQSRKEGGKIFGSGSRAPIAISILVKDGSDQHELLYHDIGDYLSRKQKLSIISDYQSIKNIPELFIPSKKVVSFHVFQKLTAFDLAYYVLRL